MDEMYKAFENRLKKGIRYHPIKPKPIGEIIERLDEYKDAWTPEENRAALFQEADKFFNNEIRYKSHKDDSKQWHKAIKSFSRYNKISPLLNLKNGPIAQID